MNASNDSRRGLPLFTPAAFPAIGVDSNFRPEASTPVRRSGIHVLLRPASWRAAARFLFALTIVTTAFNAVAQPCRPQGTALIELQVTPGEMASAGKELIIWVHDNDCVLIRMPEYYKRRGEYLFALTTTERAHLQDLQRDHQQQPYVQSEMLAQAAAIDVARSSVALTERFAVLDADHYALTLRHTGRTSSTRALAIFQYAERYPEIRSLDALQRLAAALIAFSKRDDLVAADEIARRSEAGQ
ncbi:MAG: hypothetical protein SGI99_02440 [Pseudomonadota bacterium]|nr:hypothetical protein [Pseudomonadota bacterium]